MNLFSVIKIASYYAYQSCSFKNVITHAHIREKDLILDIDYAILVLNVI